MNEKQQEEVYSKLFKLMEDVRDFRDVSDVACMDIISDGPTVSELNLEDRIRLERNDCARGLFTFILLILESITTELDQYN